MSESPVGARGPVSQADTETERPVPQQRSEQAAPQGGRPAGGQGRAQLHRRSWLVPTAAGIAMTAVGIVVLAWPAETLTVLAVLIGAALIVTGAMKLLEAFRSRGEESGLPAGNAVIGILAIIVGIFCLKDQALTVAILALVVGAFWIVHGVTELAAALSAPRGAPERGPRALAGVTSLAAGIVVLVWTGLSLTVLLALLGAWLVCYGALLIVLGVRLRRTAT